MSASARLLRQGCPAEPPDSLLAHATFMPDKTYHKTYISDPKRLPRDANWSAVMPTAADPRRVEALFMFFHTE